MDKNLLLVLLFVHVVGDFYLQTETMANKKKSEFRYVLLHFLYIIVLSVLSIIPFYTKGMLWYIIAFITSHVVIDFVKYMITWKSTGQMLKSNIYWMDQTMHILVIMAISVIYHLNHQALEMWEIGSFSGIFPVGALKLFLIVLIILKPTNITFRELFSHIKPDSVDAENKPNGSKKKKTTIVEETYNVGKLVGNLERLLVVVLLSLSQFTAIGLVFTAKSITRYDKISEDKEFAEYYLLGTLFSMLATITVYIAINAI